MALAPIVRLLDALRHRGFEDLAPEDLLDALWLAAKLPIEPREVERREEREDIRGLESPQDETGSKEEKRTPSDRFLPAPAEEEPMKGQLALKPLPAQTVRGDISAPAAPALPNTRALAKSLRPLRRRVESSLPGVLDETRTAERIAQENIWLPVLHPARERWLDCVVILDEGKTMFWWRALSRELVRLMKWLGAFRDVRVLRLSSDAPQPALHRGRSGNVGAAAAAVSPRSLVEPRGRRLVLLVTDAIAASFQDGAIAGMLEPLRGAVSIVQVLPERLWEQTGLSTAPAVRLRRRGALPSPGKVDVDAPFWLDHALVRRGLSLPAVTLEEAPLHAWARFIARRDGTWQAAFLLDQAPPPAAFGGATSREITPEERVESFWLAASPQARRLASLLAASPVLTLSVSRLVRAALLPTARPSDEAEVFLGGLLEIVDGDPAREPDAARFEFVEGVRSLLLWALPVTEMRRVLLEVSRYVEENLGRMQGFAALLEDPRSSQLREGASEDDAFARIGVEVLLRLGGDYAEAARRIRQKWAPATSPVPSSAKDSEPTEVRDPVRSRTEHLYRAVTIAIVTTLERELEILRSLLDAPVELLVDTGLEKLPCALGEIPTADGRRHVVAVFSIASRGNTFRIADLRCFPALNILLSVGLAAGISRPEQPADHVRIGDVVVATRTGVLVYQLESGALRIQVQRSVPKPNRILLNLAAEITADASRWRGLMESSALRAGIARPPAETDILTHRGIPNRRADSGRIRDVPWIHLGTVVSIKALVRDGGQIEVIRDDLSVKAVTVGEGLDTFGSGKLAHLEVRGIADYIGTPTKSDAWLSYAALAAATAARALVEVLDPRNVAGLSDTEAPSESTGSVPNNLPKRGLCIGRDGLLHALDELLAGVKTEQVTLFGLEGTGKVAVALEYAHRSMPRYPGGVFWIDANLQPEEALTALAADLSAQGPEPVRRALEAVQIDEISADGAVRLALDASAQPMLLIFADIRTPSWQGKVPGGVKSILTTTGSYLGAGVKLQVGTLEHNDAIALAEQIAGPVHDPREKASLDRVIRALDALPAAVSHAAHAMSTLYHSWEACAQDVERDPWPLLDDHRFVVATGRDTPKELLDFSLNQIGRDDASWSVLRAISVFAPAPVPLDWVLETARLGANKTSQTAPLLLLVDLGIIDWDRSQETVSTLRLVRLRVRERSAGANRRGWISCCWNAAEVTARWVLAAVNGDPRAEFAQRQPHLEAALEAAQYAGHSEAEKWIRTGMSKMAVAVRNQADRVATAFDAGTQEAGERTMASSISLTTTEERLKTQIESMLENIKAILDDRNTRDARPLVDALVQPCHELHMSLKARGLEPRHRKYMRENRRVDPTDPEFYRHVHPAQDLLKFINNPSANDDPVDQTMGHAFTFRVYTRRWGHHDVYDLQRTETGWAVSHIQSPVACDKTGHPQLFAELDHDSVNYPKSLGGYLEHVWNQASENGLSHDEVQSAINKLAEWVTVCERESPGGIFSDYK